MSVPVGPDTSRDRPPTVGRGSRASRGIDPWHTFPDSSGESLAPIGLLRTLGDVAKSAELLERIPHVEATDLVDILGQITREQQPVIQRQMTDDALHHVVDERGAVDGDGVIEARRTHEAVGLAYIGQE